MWLALICPLVARAGMLSTDAMGNQKVMRDHRQTIAVPGTSDMQQKRDSAKPHDILSGVRQLDSDPLEIPRIIHHIYKTDISDGPWPNVVWNTSYAAWLRFYPPPWYEHMWWDDSKASALFLQSCPQQYVVYKNSLEIVRADLVRYCILKTIGGIYADLDYEPRSNFYNDLHSTKVNLVQSPYMSETFQNSLMASRAGHPYWEEVLRQAVVNGQIKDNVLDKSGPGLLESLNSTFDSNVIYPLPCNSFQRATHTHDNEWKAAKAKHCMRLTKEALRDSKFIC